MKAAAGSVGISVALLFTLVLGPAPVQARPKSEPQPASTRAVVSLGKSHGYDIVLSVPAPRTAVLYAFKASEEDEPEGYVLAAYAIRTRRSRVEKGVVRASFPSLGRVSLRFHPSGKRRRHNVPYCRGGAGIEEFGTFRGTVALRGEQNFFAIERRSAAGTLKRTPRLLCRRGYAAPFVAPLETYLGPGFGVDFSSGYGTVAVLFALANRKNGYVAIHAAHQEGGPPGAEVQVQVFERLPGMMVARYAFLDEGAPGTFTTSMPGVHPATATLAPPSPFTGEARYLENSATSHSWTGNLSISLPGAEVPLAGPEFKTSLCVASPLRTPSGCDFAKPKSLRGPRLALLRRWSR